MDAEVEHEIEDKIEGVEAIAESDAVEVLATWRQKRTATQEKLTLGLRPARTTKPEIVAGKCASMEVLARLAGGPRCSPCPEVGHSSRNCPKQKTTSYPLQPSGSASVRAATRSDDLYSGARAVCDPSVDMAVWRSSFERNAGGDCSESVKTQKKETKSDSGCAKTVIGRRALARHVAVTSAPWWLSDVAPVRFKGFDDSTTVARRCGGPVGAPRVTSGLLLPSVPRSTF